MKTTHLSDKYATKGLLLILPLRNLFNIFFLGKNLTTLSWKASSDFWKTEKAYGNSPKDPFFILWTAYLQKREKKQTNYFKSPYSKKKWSIFQSAAF